MIARKEFLRSDPVAFGAQLRKEIRLHVRRAAKADLVPLIRLNVASDLDWSHIIREFPDVRFYDYSKVKGRTRENTLANYSITFSRSERTHDDEIRDLTASGRNVAVVFNVDYLPQQKRFGKLPATYLGAPVVDGDLHDFRLPEIDGVGVIVGLRLKGGTKARQNAIRSGFAVTPQGLT